VWYAGLVTVIPDAEHLLAFFAAAVVLAILPGPGLLYVLARSLGGGRSVGLRSSMGTAAGGLVHVVAAATGVSAIVALSATAFTVVKFVGAAYLIWLGLRMILTAKQSPTGEGAEGDSRAFRQGMITEALNPKTALFFLSFLPQFCQPEAGPVAVQMAILGLVVVLLNTGVDVVVAVSAGPLGRRLAANPRWWRRQRTASGGLLVGLGAYAATGSTH
jgi:threonine/homoserine/homoserine lactone efflux protein